MWHRSTSPKFPMTSPLFPSEPLSRARQLLGSSTASEHECLEATRLEEEMAFIGQGLRPQCADLEIPLGWVASPLRDHR